MLQLRQVQNLIVKNKVVLLRTDFNVPMKNGVIQDKTRIIHSLPTIKYLIAHKAKLVIISHAGSPKGNIINELSLINVRDELEAQLNIKVKFCSHSVGIEVRNTIASLQAGEVLLLENLRFNIGEEQNDPKFAHELSSLGDIYVNDAFACAHRKHASTYDIAKILPAAAGLSLLQELDNLTAALHNSNTPLTTIIGGSKVHTKLDLMENLVNKSDYIIITGTIANVCLSAKLHDFSLLSVEERSVLAHAAMILQKAKSTNCKIILPQDIVVYDLVNKTISIKQLNSKSIKSLGENVKVMDIGPKTLHQITNIVQKSNTVIWNGPVGIFEHPPFDYGTTYVSKLIAHETRMRNIRSIAGGGDTISAINHAGFTKDFTYISVGGGAFLEWLKGKSLPAIDMLAIH